MIDRNLAAAATASLIISLGYAFGAETPGPSPADAPAAMERTVFLAPAVDHHQHLLSSALAQMWSDKLLSVSLPKGLNELVASLERAWNSQAALAGLYTEDSVLVEPRSDNFVRGRSAVTTRLAHLFQSAYKLVPGSYRVEGSWGYMTVYLERGRGGPDIPFAETLMTVRRGADRRWRVVTQTLKVPGPAVLQPFEA